MKRFNYNVSEKYFSLLVTFIFLLCCETHAATVTATTQSTQLNFGKIGPGSSLGSLGSTTTVCSPTTGGIALLGGCTKGFFSITAKNAGSNVSNGKGKKKFRIHIPATVTTITPNDTALRFGTVSGCTAAASPAAPSGYIAIDCTNTSNTNNANQVWSIPVVAKLSNINPEQIGNTYTPSYALIACGCNNGCPNSISHNKCTGTVGKTFSTSLSAEIYKTLSITENSLLLFGSIASGSTPGTINQSGVATGGVTAISSAKSAGKFTISGASVSGTPYSFILPSSVTLFCDTGVSSSCSGAPSMLANLSFSSGNNFRALNSAGKDEVIVNGTLNVASNQASGDYKGIYNITVNY